MNKTTKWLTGAAAVLAAAGICFFLWPSGSSNTTNIAGIERCYKTDVSVIKSEAAAYPWDKLSEAEKFTQITFQDHHYKAAGLISEDLLDQSLGTGSVIGYDSLEEQEHAKEAQVSSILGLPSSDFIAVQLDDGWYGMQKEDPVSFETLGDVLDYASLADCSSLETFYKGTDNENPYQMDDDDPLWIILDQFQDSPAIEADSLSEELASSEEDSVTFLLSSDSGLLDGTIRVYPLGYVEISIPGIDCFFETGTDCSEMLTAYACKNSIFAEYEPENFELVGILIEVSDDYIYIDDSALCADESEGIVFKIQRNRYTDRALESIPEGSFVSLSFTGSIDPEQDYLISSPADLVPAVMDSN